MTKRRAPWAAVPMLEDHARTDVNANLLRQDFSTRETAFSFFPIVRPLSKV